MQNFSIKYGYDEETNQYIAEIPELNISDYGDTLEEAHKNLQIGLSLYFSEIYKTKKEIYA